MKWVIFAAFLATLGALEAEDVEKKATPEEVPDYIKRIQEWDPKKTYPRPAINPIAFFGLKGTVSVRDAKKLIDGGTVIVEIQDEEGTSVKAVRAAAWTREEQKNNFVTISFPGRITGHYLLRSGGDEEEALLALLHLAALASFGNADATTTTGKVDWEASAVRYLMRILAQHTYQAEPADK